MAFVPFGTPYTTANVYVLLLNRGQVLNAEMISNLVDVELILEGIKYSVKVSRIQHTGNSLTVQPIILHDVVHIYSLIMHAW